MFGPRRTASVRTIQANAARQAADNLFPDLPEISPLLVETLGPEVLVGLRIDQPDVHLDVIRIRRHAALQHIADAEFFADLPDCDRLAFVGEGGGARNNEAAHQSTR